MLQCAGCQEMLRFPGENTHTDTDPFPLSDTLKDSQWKGNQLILDLNLHLKNTHTQLQEATGEIRVINSRQVSQPAINAKAKVCKENWSNEENLQLGHQLMSKRDLVKEAVKPL